MKSLFEFAEEETKHCSVCNEYKPLHNFRKEGSYYRYECKGCAKELGRVRDNLKKEAPSVPENHKCPICNRYEEEIKLKFPNKKNVWCLDHDHKTNSFRGWICNKCNFGLGNFDDSEERLLNALHYLEQHNKGT